MATYDDDCIWVRTDVLLDVGDGTPIPVQTRTLCRNGAFVEYTGPLHGASVEVVFPEPGTSEDGYHVQGLVSKRWPDGIWIQFSRRLRSSSEMLMRNGLSQVSHTL